MNTISWFTKSSPIKCGKIFISKRTKSYLLDDFFEKILLRLKDEFQLLADNWYCYSENGVKGTEEVFALIERSYVGLFNNALVKCFPNDSVLQEYSVRMENGSYVRGDYLVRHGESNILFEAKQRQFDGRKYTVADSIKFLKPFIRQGFKYYNAEKNYYRGTTFISSLVFEWVRHPHHLDLVRKWDEEEDDGITDFYCLYRTELAGLMVYGNLEQVRKSEM